VPRVRIDHFRSKTTDGIIILYCFGGVSVEISLLFQLNIEYRFVFTFSLSISNPARGAGLGSSSKHFI